MSKTTFFKRIALTAIAALGFGMFSVAPSKADISLVTLAVTNGTSSLSGTGKSDSSTAAVITVNALFDTDGVSGDLSVDTLTVTFVKKTEPTDHSTTARMYFKESTTASGTTLVDTVSALTTDRGTQVATPRSESSVATGTGNLTAEATSNVTQYGVAAGNIMRLTVTEAAYGGAKFLLQLDSITGRTKGTYTYTVLVKAYNSSTTNGQPVSTTSSDVSITVADTAANIALAKGTVDPSKTKAVLVGGDVASANFNMAVADSSLAVIEKADGTIRASLKVTTFTEDSNPTPESVTVTITGPGLVRDSEAPSVAGKSLTVKGTGGSTVFDIISDGTAGTASIVVKTTTVTFPAKSMVFYAEKPSTVVASVNKPVISVGSNGDVVRATFKDASGNVWGGDAYIISTDDAIAGDEDPVACTFSNTNQRHECSIAGATKGSTTFKVFDASATAVAADTVDAADANVTSTAVSVRVSTGVASSVVLSFNKATYAPGEKAQLRVSVLDGEGLALPGIDITNALASGGITTASAFGAGSDTISAVTFGLSASTSSTSNTNAGHKTYVVYMPATAGVVTVSATGGTGIALAGRVAVTASATVVDTSNDAAIAASEAAQDAAAEAIDAANAATDAANLAAEAADAATVAAEEARDAADAATAAVEALATEVATLMAALKAQITTLANTVAKIAKKVKA